MMTRNKRQLFISLVLPVIILIVIYTAHHLVLHANGISFSDVMLVQAYVANVLVAFVSVEAIGRLSRKMGGNLGYLMLGTGFIKALIYLGFFKSHYNLDGEVKLYEFAAFFMPFALTLIMEVYYSSKRINT